MQERILTSGIIKDDGEEMALAEFRDRLGETEAGQYLKEVNRFGKLKHHSISDSEWGWFISRHSNVFDHQEEAMFECELALMDSEGDFSVEDRKELFRTFLGHDMGEHIVGDIPFDEKMSFAQKAEIHQKEMAALADAWNLALLDVVNYKNRLKIIDSAQKILSSVRSKKGRFFHAVERIGYENAAFNAWDSVKETTGEVQGSLRHLAHKVVPSHVPTLVRYARYYPYVDNYLRANTEMIQEILDDSKERGIPKKREYNRAVKAIDVFVASKDDN